MHMGHLRSTIIGMLSGVIEALGNKVIRQNHLGDWGLPMGMVVFKAKPIIEAAEKDGIPLEQVLPLAKLEELYKEATAESKENPQIAQACHECLVKLQQGDKELVEIWRKVVRVSMTEVYRIYGQLDVKLKPEDECGESFYNKMLAETVEVMRKAGVLEESEGALCIFLDEFKTKEGTFTDNRAKGMVAKHATFDLAIETQNATLMETESYVTDARQLFISLQIFAHQNMQRFRMMLSQNTQLYSILGEDNKPLKLQRRNVKLSIFKGALMPTTKLTKRTFIKKKKQMSL